MLIRFSFENIYSFRERSTLELEAGSIKDHLENTHKRLTGEGSRRWLKSAALYGSNASGKSNVIRAFRAMRNSVLEHQKVEKGLSLIEPFRLEIHHEKAPSYFDVEFLESGIHYRYGFSANSAVIVEEWLFVVQNNGKQENLFVRSQLGYNWGVKLDNNAEVRTKMKLYSDSTRSETLFISTLAYFNFDVGKTIEGWFTSSIVVFDRDISKSLAYTSQLMGQEKEYNYRIQRIVEQLDLGFKSIEVRARELKETTGLEEDVLLALLDEKSKGSSPLQTIHSKYDNEQEVERVYFDLMRNESLGAQKFISLLGYVIVCLRNGGRLFVDELDSRFHPNLLKIFLSLFNSTKNNPNGSQLIFSIHNTDPLKRMRRDQMIFVERDSFGGSKMQSLHVKQPDVRNDASFEKDYLKGKYGAIPLINDQLNLFD